MSGTSLAFYLFGGLALLASLGVVTLRNVMHSALCLAVALMNVAGIFVLLGAEFLAAVQILLYAGGIMVLMVFAIMLTQRLMTDHQPQTNDQWLIGAAVCGMAGAIMMMILGGTTFRTVQAAPMPQGTTATLGELLLTSYVVPFEVASLVLLAAIIGVVAIAKKNVS